MKTGNNLDTKLVAETLNMLKDAVKLAAKMSGNNKTAEMIDKKRLRLASPRLLSLVPEEKDDDVVCDTAIFDHILGIV